MRRQAALFLTFLFLLSLTPGRLRPESNRYAPR